MTMTVEQEIREKAAEKAYSEVGRLTREDGSRPLVALVVLALSAYDLTLPWDATAYLECLDALR